MLWVLSNDKYIFFWAYSTAKGILDLETVFKNVDLEFIRLWFSGVMPVIFMTSEYSCLSHVRKLRDAFKALIITFMCNTAHEPVI